MEMLTTHVLRRTDRLEMLSARYGVPVCMIMRANVLNTPEDIFACREIKIPKKDYCRRCAGGQKTAAPHTVYTVTPEDSLFGIAQAHGVTMSLILRINGIDRRRPDSPRRPANNPRAVGRDLLCPPG